MEDIKTIAITRMKFRMTESPIGIASKHRSINTMDYTPPSTGIPEPSFHFLTHCGRPRDQP